MIKRKDLLDHDLLLWETDNLNRFDGDLDRGETGDLDLANIVYLIWIVRGICIHLC